MTMPTRSSSSSSSSSRRRRSHVLLLFSFLQYLAAVVAVENSDGLRLAATHTPPPPPPPDSFLLVLRSHMPQEVSLNCMAQTPAGSNDYYSFSLHSREARRKYFSLPDEKLSDGYTVSCYYAYQGNFAADIVIFNSRQPDADQCRVKNDGCRILIEADSVLYNITRSGGKQVIGDLPAKQCKWFLFLAYDCQQKPHSHPFAGRVINRSVHVRLTRQSIFKYARLTAEP